MIIVIKTVIKWTELEIVQLVTVSISSNARAI